MKKIQIVLSLILIVGVIVSSQFSSLFVLGESTVPFTNYYEIPSSIPEYQVISTEAKTDWTAKWIWDKENLTEKNVWMCFNKKVTLDSIPTELIADISADSKYWLYINGETVVFAELEHLVERSCGFFAKGHIAFGLALDAGNGNESRENVDHLIGVRIDILMNFRIHVVSFLSFLCHI